MNNLILLIPPAINVVVTGLFAGMVLRQYLRRHHIYQLYWAIALIMAFVATVAYVSMLIVHPTSDAGIILFRTYYILGGTLMPAWLGLGSIALIAKGSATRICLTFLYLMSIAAIILIIIAKIDVTKLSQVAGTPGSGILQPGPWLAATITLNTLGLVAVAGVAIYSGWQMKRRQSSTAGVQTSHLLRANIFILIGTLLNGIAGSLARFLGLQNTFWLIMAVGWIVFFYGVALTSRRPSSTSATDTQQPKQADAHAVKS